ncbi:sugar phosphate nucleotidyltransferase [Nonomuraea insulae]|uniref:Sugar phosphate nucleotidyltransferase n=1 Tax=Nonomuraea insulae TaxID=1616787 RepID=A0ABW1D943_9ACTN
MHAIILAGGRGSRLGRHTAKVPKSLLRLGYQSILEVMILRLRACGFTRVTLCISHLGDQIRDEFGDGARFGITIDYSWDRAPLGTAAPLRHVPDWEAPALVMNGDILTSLDFGALIDAHLRHGGLMTVATHRRLMPVDFGVVDFADDLRVLGIREKPRLPVDIDAGIHVLDPDIKEHLAREQVMDMPELLTALLDQGHEVWAYPFAESWHDIGTPESLAAAVQDFNRETSRYLPARVNHA